MTQSLTRTKTLSIFILTIVLGFILFALPNLFFGITKFNGGLQGINLFYIALFQFTFVTLLVQFSLRKIGQNMELIGLKFTHFKTDILLGIAIGLGWTFLQFGLIIPNTGGAAREDISQMISMLDGSIISLVSYIILGVIGGGITEEIYNRGYFINVLKSTFRNPQIGLWISAHLSILFFCIGHLPDSALMWLDILVPTIAYTLLFIKTERLLPGIVAHGLYNMLAILMTNYLYA